MDLFHSSGTVLWLRERLNKVDKAGVIEQAVPRSITLEIPLGPEAVLVLCVESSLRTSLWEQVTLDRIGPEGRVGVEVPDEGSDLVKQEVKSC